MLYASGSFRHPRHQQLYWWITMASRGKTWRCVKLEKTEQNHQLVVYSPAASLHRIAVMYSHGRFARFIPIVLECMREFPWFHFFMFCVKRASGRLCKRGVYEPVLFGWKSGNQGGFQHPEQWALSSASPWCSMYQ
jgi:hypothetical protein